MRVQTGKGTIPWMTVLAVWSVSAVVSLPGLAISPILGDLNKVFPHATDLEIQMLYFVAFGVDYFLLCCWSGRLSVTGNKFKLLVVGLTVFFLSGFACLFINQMWLLILVSCLTGIGAGIIILYRRDISWTILRGIIVSGSWATVRRSIISRWCWLLCWQVIWLMSIGICPSWYIRCRRFR